MAACANKGEFNGCDEVARSCGESFQYTLLRSNARRESIVVYCGAEVFFFFYSREWRGKRCSKAKKIQGRPSHRKPGKIAAAGG